MLEDFVNVMSEWFEKPFDPNGDAFAWGLFLLLVIIWCLIWAHVISYLKPVVATA